MSILSISFSLFLLMDPIGNIPIFLSVLKSVPPKRQKIVILRELIIALAVIILFTFLGTPLLNLIGVEQHTVMIAGGIILFIIALKMIFPPPKDLESKGRNEKEPLIVPLAVPLVAGPAVLAAVILYSKAEMNLVITISSILIAWIASTIILMISPLLLRLLGPRGIQACERLMGLLIVLIAVQMFLEGLGDYITHPAVLSTP